MFAALIVYLLQLAARSAASGTNVGGSVVAIILYIVSLFFLARLCRMLCREAR
jgi:hypothetical protein